MFDEFRKKLALARREQADRFPITFRVLEAVAGRAYMKRAKRVTQIIPEHVSSVAHMLEAALVMAEDTLPDNLLTVSFTNEELASFVSYMRQLDTEYREQQRVILRHEKDRESKIAEALAQIGAGNKQGPAGEEADRSQIGGLASSRQRHEIDARNAQMAQAAAQARLKVRRS